MILLAEHDEPSLAAKKKQQHVALETATSTPKNRVWNFFDRPLGRPGVDPDLSWENATGSVQYSYKNASGQGYYYTRDHERSVREMCNSSGSIIGRYAYDPYGRVSLVSGSNIATKQYAGYYYHAPSALYLTLNRAYDQNTGRWLSRDSLEDAERSEGSNLYSYVQNEPMSHVDPSGLNRAIGWNFGHVWIYVQIWSTDCTRVIGWKRIDFSQSLLGVGLELSITRAGASGGLYSGLAGGLAAAYAYVPGAVYSPEDVPIVGDAGENDPPSGTTIYSSSCCDDKALLQKAEADKKHPPSYSPVLYNCRDYSRDLFKTGCQSK